MADSQDVKKIIERSTSKTTLSELQKRGYQQVKVLDETTLMKLIHDAVTNIIQGKAGLLSTEDREQIYKDARQELNRLMKEYQDTKKQADTANADKQQLIQKIHLLEKQIEAAKKMGFEEGMRSQKDYAAKLEKQVENLKAQADAQSKVANEETANQLDFYKKQYETLGTECEQLKDELRKKLVSAEQKYREGIESQKPFIETLQVRISQLEGERKEMQQKIIDLEKELAEKRALADLGAKVQDKIAAISNNDSALNDKFSSLVLKSLDGLTRKIAAMKHKLGVEEDVEYKPDEKLLEQMLNAEVESNVTGGGVETTTGELSEEEKALQKLRNIKKDK